MSGQGIVPQAISADSGDVQAAALTAKPDNPFQPAIEQVDGEALYEAQNFAVPEAQVLASPAGRRGAEAGEGAVLESGDDPQRAEGQNDEQNTLNDGIDLKWKEFTRDLFHLQNRVRKEPRWIIKHLSTQIKRFQGLKLFSHTEAEFLQLQKQGEDVEVSFFQTAEGAKAYQAAVAFLEKQRPLAPLKWNSLLYKACRDHVVDIGPKGLATSRGSDDSTPFDRI